MTGSKAEQRAVTKGGGDGRVVAASHWLVVDEEKVMVGAHARVRGRDKGGTEDGGWL